MGKHRDRTVEKSRSKTLPSSPTHSFSSSSSSDFEFTIAISPRKSSAALCPADELFYKGQLLPLQLSPRLSMVRSLLLSSSDSSARDSSSSADSSTSSFASDSSSSRPSTSSASADDRDLLLHKSPKSSSSNFFSLSRFSSVFKKDPNPKSRSKSAKDVIRKYLKKVKPLYEKLSHRQRPPPPPPTAEIATDSGGDRNFTQSFSGNLGGPRRARRSCVASCPSSIRSSPSHSGVLTRTGLPATASFSNSDSSTMEELQSAIQGAIAHCKNSMVQSNLTAGVN